MKKLAFVCFGEVNTPFERLQKKHDAALAALKEGCTGEVIDAGIVIDDPGYVTADQALSKLEHLDFHCLILCVAGWVPTHAVIRITDTYRHLPMLLWGLCGWMQDGFLVTTADQAGTCAIRPTLEAQKYRFRFVYNVIGQDMPLQEIESFTNAAYAEQVLRKVRVGTMGYRDMQLYGTAYEANSLKEKFGVEVESFEMLEMLQLCEQVNETKLAELVSYVKNSWKFERPCDEDTIERGARYALAIGQKILERGYKAISLLDVDGMKKLLHFPPAMVFMLLERYFGVLTIPENDVLGSMTQLIAQALSGQCPPYLEYYEFFAKSMLIGVPDFISLSATDGEIRVLPTAFGQLASSLLNVSKVKDGLVTCLRLNYLNGEYTMHMYLAEAKQPPRWQEYGWTDPVPQLPSLEVFPLDCSVNEFAQKVDSQHVILIYGDQRDAVREFCRLLNIRLK